MAVDEDLVKVCPAIAEQSHQKINKQNKTKKQNTY